MVQRTISFFPKHFRKSGQTDVPLTPNILAFPINQDIFQCNYKINQTRKFILKHITIIRLHANISTVPIRSLSLILILTPHPNFPIVSIMPSQKICPVQCLSLNLIVMFLQIPEHFLGLSFFAFHGTFGKITYHYFTEDFSVWVF